MMQKYFKNVFITFGIITLVWVNVSFAYRTKKEIGQMTEVINNLHSELEESKQNEVSTQNALDEAEDKIENLVSQKLEEAAKIVIQDKPKIVVKTAPVVQAPTIPQPVIVKPVVEVVRPSRVSRAS